MNGHGGSKPVSMRSKSLVSCGETRAGTRPRLRLKASPELMPHSILATRVPRSWARAADVLTDLAASVELFHTADGTAFADLIVDGHRETWPVRSNRLRSWLRRKYYEASGTAAGSERSIRHSTCLRHGRNLRPRGGPFTCASRSTMVASIWISLTSYGVRLRLGPKDGELQRARRSGSAGLPACSLFLCR